jgi:hypothetical protein
MNSRAPGDAIRPATAVGSGSEALQRQVHGKRDHITVPNDSPGTSWAGRGLGWAGNSGSTVQSLEGWLLTLHQLEPGDLHKAKGAGSWESDCAFTCGDNSCLGACTLNCSWLCKEE